MVGARPILRTEDRVVRDTPAALARRMAQEMTPPRRPLDKLLARFSSYRAARTSLARHRGNRRFSAVLLIQGTSLPESSAQAVERTESGVTTVVRKLTGDAPYPVNVTFNEQFAGNNYVPPRARETTASIDRGPVRVATLVDPKPPVIRSALAQARTKLVGLQSAAFPYLGNNPRTDQPFLNVSENGRRGHRGPNGRVYWQDETYNDNRVLVHIPKGFDVRKPGVIVVFFHGNGATLERDVRDRQLVPQRIPILAPMPCCSRPNSPSMRSIPARENSGSRAASSASSTNRRHSSRA